jgi:hypothetical protein
MFNGAQPGRPGRARPTWSRWLLLVLSIVTLLMTTAAPADAGGAGSSPDITSAPVSPTTATPLTWAFTSSAAATSCELVRGTTVVSALATCVSGAPSATFDVSADPGGSYTFTVYDADAADVNGTTPSDTSTVDVAPVAPTVSRTTASPGSSRSPEWTFDTPTGATDACELDDPDGNAVDTESPCTSPYDADLTGDDLHPVGHGDVRRGHRCCRQLVVPARHDPAAGSLGDGAERSWLEFLPVVHGQ